MIKRYGSRKRDMKTKHVWDYNGIRHISLESQNEPMCALQNKVKGPFSLVPPLHEYKPPCKTCLRFIGTIAKQSEPKQPGKRKQKPVDKQPKLF